jgi:uncharacterized protein
MLTVRSNERICQPVFAGIPVSFSRDQSSPLTVRQVEPGAIRIGDETITENVVIFRDEVQRDITIDDVATLQADKLDELLGKGPEIVILGTGWQAQRPPRELVFEMARRGIGFETMDTPAACRTFNILLGDDRDVAAVLIIKD